MRPVCSQKPLSRTVWRLHIVRNLASFADAHAPLRLDFLHPRSFGSVHRFSTSIATRGTSRQAKKAPRVHESSQELEDGSRSDTEPYIQTDPADVQPSDPTSQWVQHTIGGTQSYLDANQDTDGIGADSGTDWHEYTLHPTNKCDVDDGNSRRIWRASRSSGRQPKIEAGLRRRFKLGDEEVTRLRHNVLRYDTPQFVSVAPAPPDRQWTPYSEKGREDLKTLLGLLKQKQRDMKKADSRNADGDAEPPKPLKISDTLPESPILRRMRREREHKRQPFEKEDKYISKNPWAKILASPVRTCQATGLRLPSNLLVEWGLVANPHDEKVYLMPKGLTGTEQLRLRPNAAEAGEAARDKKELEVPGGGRLYLLPLQQLNQRLTELYAGRSSEPGMPFEFGNKKLPISKLWGNRWNDALAAALKTHRKTQRQRAESGNPEAPNELGVDGPIIASQVKWQGDIDTRMVGILQKRVLRALEDFVKQPNRGNAICVTKLPLPGKGNQGNPESIGEAESKNNTQLDKILHLLGGSIFLQVGVGAHGSPEALQSVATTGDCSPSWYLQPRYEPKEKERIQLIWTPNVRSSEPEQETQSITGIVAHPLIPPTINIAHHLRLPVFSLQQLFGTEPNSNLASLLRDLQSLTSPPFLEGQQQSSEVSQASTQLILIRPSEPRAQKLTSEIWRLWRYIGGHKVDREMKYTGDIFGYRKEMPQKLPVEHGVKRLSQPTYHRVHQFVPEEAPEMPVRDPYFKVRLS